MSEDRKPMTKTQVVAYFSEKHDMLRRQWRSFSMILPNWQP